MTESLVTVLIPSHNRPAFLAEALASVLAQDYERFTVLVADDRGVVRKSFVGPTSATHLWAAVAEARDPH